MQFTDSSLLLIYMDIETYPDPNENDNNTKNALETFHLNDRSTRNKSNNTYDIISTFSKQTFNESVDFCNRP